MPIQKTQVVSGSGSFNTAEVTDFATTSQLASAGVRYQIVAITGPQSSGKSTLLNHVVSEGSIVLDLKSTAPLPD